MTKPVPEKNTVTKTKSALKQLPKNTVELEITIPWNDVKASYEEVFSLVAKDLEVPGFRKGKAPKEIVEKNIQKTRIYEEVVKRIIPKAYQDAVMENQLRPVSAPKIEVVKAKENEDWVVKATIALKPKIDLKDYKDKIKDLKQSKTKIWVPGETGKKEEDKKPTLDEIVNTLLSATDVELADVLVDEETNRLLSQLIDQTQKLGLTIEQYLMAKGKTTESVREEYKQNAIKNLKTEFILAEIADKENIVVTQEDIDKLLENVKDPQEREKARKDSYYLAHLLRQQKTLDFINSI